MKILARCLGAYDRFGEIIGKAVSWLAILLTIEYCWEVFTRSLLNAPTNWVYESSTYLFGALFALGGAYAFKSGSMVSVDLIPKLLSTRPKALFAIICDIVGIMFLLALTGKATSESMISIQLHEVSASPWAPPVYPLKLIIALGSCLLGLQVLVSLIRDSMTLIRGKEETK